MKTDADKWLELEEVCVEAYGSIQDDYPRIETYLDMDKYDDALDCIRDMRRNINRVKRARAIMDTLNVEITSEGVRNAEV